MGSILYNIFIMPLEMLFQVLFSFVRFKPVYGLFIISIVVNFLALPLYMRADAIQAEERDKVNAMSKWVSHIKKTFKGDERYMMLTEYYNSQNYKPIYSLRSTFSLLLQIPFFMAAYNFLSNIQTLKGVSFFFINDLGAPDAMFSIGGFTVNVLPIVMTLLNFISAYIYLKGFPIKDKIQTYGIAIIFLVLLYDRPAGLVLYWTLNQVFSALKNVFLKLFKERKTKDIVFSISGLVMAGLFTVVRRIDEPRHIAIFLALLLIPQLPMLVSLIKRILPKEKPASNIPTSIFAISELFLTVLVGLVIPLSVISSEPEAFAFGVNSVSKILTNNFTLAIGFFVVWVGVFYYLSNKKARNCFTYVSVFLSVMAILNYMCFTKKFGTISKELIFDKEVVFSLAEKLINALVLVLIAILVVLLVKRFKKIVKYVISFALVGLIGMVCVNGFQTNSVLVEVESRSDQETKQDDTVTLSKNGKNVVVLFLDRAIGGHIPYIMNEKPELKEAFEGFTYYSNTLSFGGHTNFAAPVLYGGYEYTPDEMNKRSDETLESKHDEALRVLPTIFANNGYSSTLCDPPYVGYHEISDLSLFENDNFNAFNLESGIDDESIKNFSELQLRNFFMYSVYQVSPTIVKQKIYDQGQYMSADLPPVRQEFLDSYKKLEGLKNVYKIEDDASNNFSFVESGLTHKQIILATPNYSLTGIDRNKELNVDKSRFVLADGRRLNMDSEDHVAHYHINMFAMLTVKKFLDYLKENNVYDNTRIIIVADHAIQLEQNTALMFDKVNAEQFNPLLLVKDFNEKGELHESTEFMTNADVPTIALEGLVSNPTNPFTGKAIDSHKKIGKQKVTTSHKYNLEENNGNVFDTSDGEWWYVEKNIFDENNWQLAK